MGMRDKPTAPASPWRNGVAERLIGSIRRQCSDQVIVPGEASVQRSGFINYVADAWERIAADRVRRQKSEGHHLSYL
jgi:hypothetical protein